MNKKISTLMAGAMLASVFSLDASAAMENGKSCLLKAGSKYLSTETNKESSAYGQLKFGAIDQEILNEIVAGTWKVSTKTTSGAVVYTFVNKVTGMTLAVDPTQAKTATNRQSGTNLTLGSGTISEWAFNADNKMYSYFSKDSVVYFDKDGVLHKDVYAKVATEAVAITDDKVSNPVPLTADDLNSLMCSSDVFTNYFALNMTPEVSTGKANHLTATGLQATQVGDYVTLAANGKKDGDDNQQYVVVDTAYYEGTEASSKLLKYTYDKMDADFRLPGSYKFKFTYNVTDDKLFVQVEEVAHKLVKGSLADNVWAEMVKANNNSLWSDQGLAPNTLETLKDKYIYMAKLDGTNVLTVNTNDTDGGTATTASQNITIKTTADYTNLTLTTMPEGVYLIQYKGVSKKDKVDTYVLANLAGNFGWVAQARNQNFKHMPAAQWVVKKNGTSSIAPITITNREFADQISSQAIPANPQLFAVAGSNDKVFYFNGAVKDTVSFIKVDAALVADKKLGYKYVDENDTKVQTYLFNYLHGLAFDKYLNAPAGKDSIVRVDETGAKANFRLELVVSNDKYGYADELVRNAYYIIDGKGRYLSYDTDTKKYMMKSIATPYFLKENNCIDGNPYYTLVEANVGRMVTMTKAQAEAWYPSWYAGLDAAKAKTWSAVVGGSYDADGKLTSGGRVVDTEIYDKEGNSFVCDYSKVDYYTYQEVNGKIALKKVDTHQQKSSDYAFVKVSVDDNTLDLVRGNLNDKFENGTFVETRTSAFAVNVDKSPLYRRFNIAALGEKENGKDSLTFVESIRKEYLMDEANDNLTHKTVNYAGIWDKEKANGKLAFRVDTAWVQRGLGEIKPQYLVSVARDDQDATPGVPCTYSHNHFDNEGNPVTADKCGHAVQGHAGFAYGKYLVNFSDSVKALVDREETTNPYQFSTKTSANASYTRIGFVPAIKSGDSLFVLTNGLEKMKASELDTATIIANYKKAKLEHFIVNLKGDKHKNVTWSFRYINPDKALLATEEGEDNAFLFESNVYGNGDGSYTTVKGNADEAIAPKKAAAWVKMQNGCLVLTDRNSEFSSAKTNGDGALVFNVGEKATDMATDNDQATVAEVTVIAGEGQVTIVGAAGKTVVISNILGQVIANTVIASDYATIAIPAGVVVVAVEGEAAVKAIVK